MGLVSVRPEHILIGLIREKGGIGACLVQNAGVNLHEALKQFEQLTTAKQSQSAGPPADVDSTTFEAIATAICIKMGHEGVGTEHLLLSVLEVDDRGLESFLGEIGSNTEMIRAQLNAFFRQ